MTHQEMLALSEDSKEWRDAADFKDNAARIRQVLEDLPDLLLELKNLKEFAQFAHQDFDPRTDYYATELSSMAAEALGIKEDDDD